MDAFSTSLHLRVSESLRVCISGMPLVGGVGLGSCTLVETEERHWCQKALLHRLRVFVSHLANIPSAQRRR